MSDHKSDQKKKKGSSTAELLVQEAKENQLRKILLMATTCENKDELLKKIMGMLNG